MVQLIVGTDVVGPAAYVRKIMFDTQLIYHAPTARPGHLYELCKLNREFNWISLQTSRNSLSRFAKYMHAAMLWGKVCSVCEANRRSKYSRNRRRNRLVSQYRLQILQQLYEVTNYTNVAFDLLPHSV